MKITYLNHSGFVLELEHDVLIFDYYRGELPALPKEKNIYVFSSHAHPDHFQKKIYDWDKLYGGITYILSDDIQTEGRNERIIHVGPRQELEADGLHIKTFRSTDEGVAFLIRTEGKTIYHAGDLNWWHWEEESIDYNRQMRKDYQREIRKLVRKKIDLAFVVLDPRQGGAAFSGIDFFMRNVRVNHVFPMHMWRDYGLTDRLLTSEISASYRNRIHRVWEEGQTVEIHGQKGET